MQIKNFSVALAKKYAKEICESLDQIRLVERHTLEQILADKKGDRVLHAKWHHSLIALSEEEEYIGLVIGYEREAEGNEQYPINSIYLSDLAIAEKFQGRGFGRELVKNWIELNRKIGFLELSGDFAISLQTNSASWNKHVQDLYESFGFKKAAKKIYENRVDDVYFLS